jgi:hypothetical protein
VVNLPKSFLGFEVPSDSFAFLTVLSLHIVIALTAVVTGAGAMLSMKRPGRHPMLGTIYFWCLCGVFLSATALAAMRWSDDYYLFILGTLSFGAASIGRMARRQQWPAWVTTHIWGMGLSYIVMLTAFYVDNGKNLPLWRELPHIAYWVLPGVVGIPLIVRALLRYR